MHSTQLDVCIITLWEGTKGQTNHPWRMALLTVHCMAALRDYAAGEERIPSIEEAVLLSQ